MVIAKSFRKSDSPARFVVAVNESRSSQAALHAAARLAKAGDVICLFHVLDRHRHLSTGERKQLEDVTGHLHETTQKAIAKAPVLKRGAPEYTKTVLEKYEHDKARRFHQLHAERRGQRIMKMFKQYGYNVMIMNADSEDEERHVDNVNLSHPIVRLANKIANVAVDLKPTYLVMGIGNYDSRTIGKYYEAPNHPPVASNNTDRYNTLTTITEVVADHPLVRCSVIAAVK